MLRMSVLRLLNINETTEIGAGFSSDPLFNSIAGGIIGMYWASNHIYNMPPIQRLGMICSGLILGSTVGRMLSNIELLTESEPVFIK